MCAIVSEMWVMGQFDWLGAPVGARSIYSVPSVPKMKL